MKTALLLLMGAALLAPVAASAQQYVYPAKGQSASKQAKDETACEKWATKQTGFHPSTPPPPMISGKTEVTGSGARVAGAAGGALVAGVAGGNAGTGALVGAAVGGLTKRGMARREANKQNEANQQAYQANVTSYNNARMTCLQGRGYTVN
jgi:hypothetical protein